MQPAPAVPKTNSSRFQFNMCFLFTSTWKAVFSSWWALFGGGGSPSCDTALTERATQLFSRLLTTWGGKCQPPGFQRTEKSVIPDCRFTSSQICRENWFLKIFSPLILLTKIYFPKLKLTSHNISVFSDVNSYLLLYSVLIKICTLSQGSC